MASRLKPEAAPVALTALFHNVRALSVALAAPLSDADATAQSMPDASPAKWHLAHSSWFFETFVLRDHVPGYRLFDARWPFLFNSYYDAEGPRHARPERGLLTRPSLGEVLSYRAHVDAALLRALPDLPPPACALVELGCHHEQQHQELLLTDILHLFSRNPLLPAVWDTARSDPAPEPGPLRWLAGRAGLVEIGDAGVEGFAFDCERPRHPVQLQPHLIADRPISNGEWCTFIDDGGYRRPEMWLADGWAWVEREAIFAPLYWQRDGHDWMQFALDGLHPLRPGAPVSHISYYEADAFARWAGARLPSEAEWEAAAAAQDPLEGNQLDRAEPVRPRAAAASDGLRQMFGDVWEWTGSAYLAHPGFRTAPGAVGEYNGKFMCGQFVLKGGSCATPRGHARASYRNFFYPHQRWQFSGVRLARDI
ncbi:ergothioneine biosynthesis protein EgtB [Sphingomonas sp. C3-2]|uniref:ergothioneine biosynthesis protein EgtB n=1 Tax=Sphingomonas sp. C3-2 TaxID=3062169 RepID=UPI00294B27E4|nr:ergothioneine biosynthesis protein EgtB [Sphingomonas sp. C3-2]WOK35233.1 ergothioneine biosynthesis protein EgtB [Sphingomonas sp. C3-2]